MEQKTGIEPNVNAFVKFLFVIPGTEGDGITDVALDYISDDAKAAFSEVFTEPEQPS